MKIDILDKIFSEKIFTYRVCKIRYSYAFENCLEDKITILEKKYNIYTINQLFTESSNNDTGKNRFREWVKGIIKNILGLIPTYGTPVTILFSVSDTISFLKISDLQKLRDCLRIKENPHKKYNKIKNAIIVKNCSYLNEDEIKKVRFIKELIEKKYIVNTLLIICEPLDFSSNITVNKEATYEIALDNNLLNEICGFYADDNSLKLINVLGIEYAEIIKELDNASVKDNELLVQNFINSILKKNGYNQSEELTDFLKLCSLLFDVFSYNDIEKVSCIKKICCETELEKSVELKLIEDYVPNEYRFFKEFLRKYYQKHAQFYGSNVKREILDYLKEKYSDKYTDLALASILTSCSEEEKISLCLKGLYYEKNKIPVYKTIQITEYLSMLPYLTIKNISKLSEIYTSSDYSNTDAKRLCMESYLGIAALNFLSAEDKLICLSNIAKVSYEVMTQDFLKELDKKYRELLHEIRISNTYKKYSMFIFDYLVFTTSIQNSFETTQVAQRLVACLNRTSMSLETKIKFLRLGNAIFYNDYDKGQEMTMEAYNLSESYPMEHIYSTINYSCSLGTCGKYEEAHKILKKEFNSTFFRKNAVCLSATNNYIIVSYLSGLKDTKWLLNKMSTLNGLTNAYKFSDKQILNNNLLATYILDDYLANNAKIIELVEAISLNETDTYHLFFMHYNMMVYYFLLAKKDEFVRERDLSIIPELLKPYSDFFISKANFLEENINNNWDIIKLQIQLSKWGECYPENKYTVYKYPVLFGFIERWFE